MTNSAHDRRIHPAKSTTRGVLAAIGVSVLVLAGCSSGSSDAADPETPTTAVETDTSAEAEPDATSGGDSISEADCQVLLEGRARFATSATQLSVIEDQDAMDLVFGEAGIEEAQAYIALLRPHQDVEPEVFGPLRDGLDNMENDLIAVQEGRLDDRVGDYGVAAIVPVLEAIGC